MYFNLDLVTGLEIAVECFVTLSLEQLVPRADRTDPVLAYDNLRWHRLDRRGRNHLSNGLHRKLDLVSSTHCGKAKADAGYCYEVAYSVNSIRVFERTLACRRTKPTVPLGVRFQTAGWIYAVGRVPKKPHAKAAIGHRCNWFQVGWSGHPFLNRNANMKGNGVCRKPLAWKRINPLET